MSFVNINGINVYYEEAGEKGKKVVLLHGWGQNTQMMAFISEHLKDRFIIYNIDFPGFGKSDIPESAWDTEDYTTFLHLFCQKMGIDNPIFIAHSFGCRIAIRYAHHYGAYKMILAGAAGVRDKRTLSWYIKVYSYKLAKKVLGLKPFVKYKEILEKKVGSQDYQQAQGVMRQTFVKVVNEDVTPLLKDVNCETLLLFGENDEQTPVSKGKLMEKLMPNSALAIFENDDHYAYINEAPRFCRVLDAFFKGDY